MDCIFNTGYGRVIAFGILSLPVIFFSWRSLFNFKSHGFFRFLSWECIIWLLVSNLKFWFDHPFGTQQMISWIFLFFSGYLVIAGLVLLKNSGKPDNIRDEKSLFEFEKTTELIDHGIYKFIRHPLYSSLIFLTWGIFLKQPTDMLFLVALSSTAFLFLTALCDEKECIIFFGVKYKEYMKLTKRFIPFLI
jgi:protein-S-isoprenylcysteine O-methyltransferase Ste14